MVRGNGKVPLLLTHSDSHLYLFHASKISSIWSDHLVDPSGNIQPSGPLKNFEIT